MSTDHARSLLRLVNGSMGDPALYVDYPGRDNALLFDAGDNANLDRQALADLTVVFLTHFHIDHLIGFDRILRVNLDRDKVLQVFGPPGTIANVYRRIKCYEIPYFPFQKLVLRVFEIDPDARRAWVAELECQKRFPEPVVRESPLPFPKVYSDQEVDVEAAAMEHTVPCLAYALIERAGYCPDTAKLQSGPLRPGGWIKTVLELIRAGAPGETPVEIQGGQFPLERLTRDYFSRGKGRRIAYVVDTAWTERTQPKLISLARKAFRLYCDCGYAAAQSAQATKHRHMTATQAAELANAAEVEQLVLLHFSVRYHGKPEVLLDEARAIFPNTTAELTSRTP